MIFLDITLLGHFQSPSMAFLKLVPSLTEKNLFFLCLELHCQPLLDICPWISPHDLELDLCHSYVSIFLSQFAFFCLHFLSVSTPSPSSKY